MISASELNSYCFCPRSIYLSKVLRIRPERTPAQARGLVSHAIRRELSLRQPKVLCRISDAAEIGPAFEREVERVLADVPHIYRNLLSGIGAEAYVAEVRAELLREFTVLSEKLTYLVEQFGFDEAVRLLTPKWVEYSVRSDSLMLSGRIDKVMAEDSLVPVEIKTGAVPTGVWEGDRIQTCAYVMLLEDALSLPEPIGVGFVEYTRVHERRPVQSTEGLRRRVIESRDAVAEILAGSIPDVCPHGSARKCDACGFKEQCYDI
jgi:CRISPR/Cas system-associated exonuclease Cas4 (RecB family)